MPSRHRRNPLQAACQSLLDLIPAREPEDKPYLRAWLRTRHSLPAEAAVKLAEIVIESLLYRGPPGEAPERREFVQRRAESVLLRLESVLARAAGKITCADARQHRGVAQLIRYDGVRRRSALLQKLRP